MNAEETQRVLDLVDTQRKNIQTLAEQIINFLGLIDNPVGRMKMGIDPNGKEENFSMLTITEAKQTLRELEGQFTFQFINQYSHHWRMP